MNNKELQDLVKTEQYKFLDNDEHLGENIILLTIAGSYAYGTNADGSDIDIRGICLERKKEYWGLSKFEQFEDKYTDTTIYGLKKVVNLLLNSNPNIIEILGVEDEQIIKISKQGLLLKNNLNLFLSKKAYHSFGGYATAQLRRLQNALARDNYPQSVKEKHILESINRQFEHFKHEYHKITNGNLDLYIDKSYKNDFEDEIYIDINLKHYPLRDLKAMYSDMSNVIKNYESLNHRNSKKDEIHLNKHAMHLIRLLLMGTEVLESGIVKTYRDKDREFLMNIRNGAYKYEEIFEMVDELEKKFEYAYENTSLAEKPDYEKIEELMIDIYEYDV